MRRNYGPNITLLTALPPESSRPALAITGFVTEAVFIAYTQRVLTLSLRQS